MAVLLILAAVVVVGGFLYTMNELWKMEAKQTSSVNVRTDLENPYTFSWG